MSSRLIIFDLDGVIVDRETLANQVLADELTLLGCPTTLDEAFDTYMGYHWDDCLELVKRRWGAVPTDLRARVDAAIEARLPAELQTVSGAEQFIRQLGPRPRCIASSSPPEWLQRRLAMFGLDVHFGENLFSASVHVARGKPHPDIYLFAAQAMGAEPSGTVVIEDSPTGVKAGVAAGMTVIGLCAGNHIRDGHADQLRAAGAHHVVTSFDEVARLI